MYTCKHIYTLVAASLFPLGLTPPRIKSIIGSIACASTAASRLASCLVTSAPSAEAACQEKEKGQIGRRVDLIRTACRMRRQPQKLKKIRENRQPVRLVLCHQRS